MFEYMRTDVFQKIIDETFTDAFAARPAINERKILFFHLLLVKISAFPFLYENIRIVKSSILFVYNLFIIWEHCAFLMTWDVNS